MGLLKNIHDIGLAVEAMCLNTQKTEAALDRIQLQLEKVTMKLQDFTDLLTAVNTETDLLAAKIQKLMEQVSGSSLTGEEEATILAGLQAVKNRLTVMAADPADPVPTPEPTPAPDAQNP